MIKIIDAQLKERGIHLEKILLTDLTSTIIHFKQKILHDFSLKKFKNCEENLAEFCFSLIDLDDEEQIFVIRIFFTSLVMNVMQTQAHKNQLHPKVLSEIFDAILKIDSIHNISGYLLYIPHFIKAIKKNILNNHPLLEENVYVEEILSLINLHLKEDYLSVQWIAKQLKFSTTHLNNLFREHMEQTIGSYIAERRINEIAYKIITTSHPIKKICKKYGFVNYSHFIQRFKSMKGKTPLQYRKQYFIEDI